MVKPAQPVTMFEGIGMCFYEVGPMACPKRGQYYLSGALVEAWRAFADLSTVYRIVTPTHLAKQVMYYEPGAEVPKLPDGRVSWVGLKKAQDAQRSRP